MSLALDRLATQLDWNLLRTFMVIVQERSITSAAQRLNVTQPSISAALRRLEDRLDVQLIERGSGRVFQITSAGEKVYREALEIYGGVIRLNQLGNADDQILAGNIVIYHSTHLDMSFLHKRLAAFRGQHPGVTFSMNAIPCAEVTRALQQRIASIGFCSLVEAAPQLTRRRLASQMFGFFCGPSHPLFNVSDADPDDLAASDTIGFDGETLTGGLAQVVRYKARHDIGKQMIATTSSIVDLINMLRHMPAIGCMALHHAEHHAPDLWPIPLAETELLIDAYAVTDTERHVTPAERALVTFLAEADNASEGFRPSIGSPRS